LPTVSGENHASSLITATQVISETVSSNESSVITALFGNNSQHARSSETEKGCSTTVSGENHASSSMSATKISAQSVKKAIKAHKHVQASWKTTTYCVIVTVMLASFATEVHREVSGPGIATGEYTNTGATTGQWGDFRTGTPGKCTVFQVQPDKIRQQRSVQLQKWRTQHSEMQISEKQTASTKKTGACSASTTNEAALGKLYQIFSDYAEAEATAEKESRTVEQTERKAAQVAQQVILQDIHTALESMSKRVAGIEETQQREWQT